MNLNNIVLILVFAIGAYSCDRSENKSLSTNTVQPIPQALELYPDSINKDIFLGRNVNINIDGNNIVKLCYFMNVSEVDLLNECLLQIPHTITSRLGLYHGIEMETGSSWDHYISYRINEYYEDWDYHIYPSFLIESFKSVNKADSLFLDLFLYESLYVQEMNNNNTLDSNKLDELAKSFTRFINRYSDNNRGKYLLARIYAKNFQFDEANKLYNELIYSNYYKDKILVELSRISLLGNDSISLKNAVTMHSGLYSNSCNRYILDFVSSEHEFLSNYKKCIENGTKKDSIYAVLSYIDFKLKKRKFDNIETELNFFLPSVSDSFHSFAKSKRRYLGIKYFFMTGQGEKLCDFLSKNSASNVREEINSKHDLYLFLKRINQETHTTDDFDKYFSKNFMNCTFLEVKEMLDN